MDNEDFDQLSKYKWYAAHLGHTWYAQRGIVVGGRRTTQKMHSFLLGSSTMLDHADGNGLNNQRANLRHATASQNQANKRKTMNGSLSKYKGVTRKAGKWQAQICIGGESHYLGLYPTEEEAARVYDAEARKGFGQYAFPNFPLAI